MGDWPLGGLIFWTAGSPKRHSRGQPESLSIGSAARGVLSPAHTTKAAYMSLPQPPVRFIEGDDRSGELGDGMALCLSGGGCRAMLFHVGALWRLHELE